MAFIFGLTKKIIEHPTYNLGLALPFVVAFYLLNDTQPLVIPLISYPIGEQLSLALKIVGVALYYIVFLFFFVIAGGFSRLTTDSKLYLGYPIFTLIVAGIALLTKDETPTLGLLFGVLSLVYLLLSRLDEGNLSLLLIGATGTLLSLFSFVAGVLWFEGHFVFAPVIASLFGFASLTPESLKVGWPMLITVGYVLFYAIFQTGELWGENPS